MKTLLSALLFFASSIAFAHPVVENTHPFYSVIKRLPVAICKFNGTAQSGEFFPDCIGVSSIVKQGTGHYTVNLSKPMESTNYVIQVVSESTVTNDTNQNSIILYDSITTDSFDIKTGNTHGVQGNHTSVHVVVYPDM